jgi:AbrB family looped-hinge helix DNA binding protein
MAYSSTISSKGQVTVPQEIRMRLGLKEGDRVEFVVEGGNTVIRPLRSEENPFEAYAGALEGAFPHGVREVNAWVEEMRREKRSRR